jgi:hypothetical protein
MENFRQFEAGPDPFGVTWQVQFKWMQTAISLRHSDTVDVKFLLTSEDQRQEKTIAMQHTDLLTLSRTKGRPLTDAWCSRLAALHLKHQVEAGEDIEKTLVTVPLSDLERYDAILREEELAALKHSPAPTATK